MRLKVVADSHNDWTKWGIKKFRYTGFLSVRRGQRILITEDVSMREPLTVIRIGGPASSLNR